MPVVVGSPNVNYTPNASCNKLFRMNGIDTATVAADAVRAMDIAANGNASFSLANAAVPNPCAAAPIPNPRATASRIPKTFNIADPKLAPIKPVMTTIDTANEMSAPNIVAIAMANGDVIFRDNNDKRKYGEAMFNNRTINAVPYKPPKVDTEMAVPNSVKFCRIKARLSYMDTASDTTAGPNRNNNTSPGPNNARLVAPVL